MKRVIAFVLTMLCFSAHANLLLTSPTGYGGLGASVPSYGGAVIDIIGNNENRVLSYISERELLHAGLVTDENGFAMASIGTLSFSQEMLDALVGGIAQIAIRLTMWDGDNSLLNGVEQGFHANKNFLYVNGSEFGNFSNVDTQTFERFGGDQVDTDGVTGFITDYSAVGWFSSTDSTLMQSISDSIFSSGMLSMNFVIKGAHADHANFISFSDRFDDLQYQAKSFTSVQVPEPSIIGLILLAVAMLSFRSFKKRT